MRHPLWRQRKLQLAQIVQQPLVRGEAGTYSRNRVLEVCHRYNLAAPDSVVVETSSDEYTLAGMGIGIAIGTGRLLACCAPQEAQPQT